MSDGYDLDEVRPDSIDECKRKAWKDDSPGGVWILGPAFGGFGDSTDDEIQFVGEGGRGNQIPRRVPSLRLVSFSTRGRVKFDLTVGQDASEGFREPSPTGSF